LTNYWGEYFDTGHALRDLQDQIDTIGRDVDVLEATVTRLEDKILELDTRIARLESLSNEE